MQTLVMSCRDPALHPDRSIHITVTVRNCLVQIPRHARSSCSGLPTHHGLHAVFFMLHAALLHADGAGLAPFAGSQGSNAAQ